MPAQRSYEERDAYSVIYELLQYYGLEGLGDWLWEQITGDVPESEIFIKLRQTDQYKKRFPGMSIRTKNGLRALSEEEYIRTEQGYRMVLQGMGVDPRKYDDPKDYLDFFSRDLSVEEVTERGVIWRTLTQAPSTTANVKSLFNQYAGLKNLKDEDLFEILVTNDNPKLNQLYQGMQGKVVQKDLSISGLKEMMQQALAKEAATFRGGGGFITEQQGLRTGLVGQGEEQI